MPVQLAVTSKGQTVVVLSEKAGCVMVKYPNGRIGWLKASDVSKI